ncbi:hypothetical protein HYY72_00935 [Candidatus Woesearchaeota archaeon]|nr:hypothetical protein [Candidatus Woesearchaeota archaeon]
MVEQKQALKAVKKKWFLIYASKSFDEALIGESLVVSPSELVGRIVTVNLMSLTDDIRQQHINLKFKVAAAENDRATAELVAFEVMPAAIKRLVRRGIDRIDASFICETSDGKKIRIKPFLLTKAYAGGMIIKGIRKALMEHIASEVKKLTFDDLVKLLLANKLQTGIKSALKKVYPIKSCEIKYACLVSKGAALEVSGEGVEDAGIQTAQDGGLTEPKDLASKEDKQE